MTRPPSNRDPISWPRDPEKGLMEIRNKTGEEVEVEIEEDRSIGPVRVEEGEVVDAEYVGDELPAERESPRATPRATPQKGTRNTRSARGLANLPVDRETFDFFLGAAEDLRIPVEKVVELVQEDIKRLLRGELYDVVATEPHGEVPTFESVPSLDERVTMEFARRVEERRKQRGGGR